MSSSTPPAPAAEMGNFFQRIKSTGLIILGILCAGMGLKGFLLSSHFIDGGVTGISMLISAALGIPLSWLLLIINLPFVILGYRQIGLGFALKSAAAIAGLSLALAVVPYPTLPRTCC
ncbi:YitT family protein [Hymenobacter cellulosilyticus]|uniref:YitT family protein n=1 Tax=Hymenobacter cellulosilyticus TaxID=2932248 RepID=UPI0028808D4C|nr:YitT family protein [Hymenobacter cellulosilyticus]